MRPLALAALTMVTVLAAGQADAQRLDQGGSAPGAPYPVPGTMRGSPPPPPPMSVDAPQRPHPGPMNGPRPYPDQNYQTSRPAPNGEWQGGAHWSGGMNAPGGWNAYRRPSRGFRLPSYWVSPTFYIGDFGRFGLYPPPQGYGWQRYYDDAVLVDGRGKVRDMVYGLDWDGGYGYGQGGPDYSYPPQYHPLPPVVQNGTVTTYSTSSGYAGGGYASGGYYYPGATTTVVTIQSAPSVTTTTTEYVEERTRTHYVAPRRVYRAKRRVYRPAPCGCRRAAPVEKPVLGS